MKRLLYIPLLMLYAFSATAADNNALYWKRANEAYQHKQYDTAAAYYEQIVATGVSGTDLYFNLGNAYYKLNRIPDAVLQYERALFTDPANKKAAENLALTQSRITNRIQAPADIFFVRWWQSVTSSNNATAWAVVSLLCFLALLTALALRRQGILSLPVQVYVFSGIFFIFFLVFAYTSALHKRSTRKAVVMTENTPMATEPGQAKTQRLIPQGTTVVVTSETGNWLMITLPDGRSGQMPRSAISFVQPGKH
jgi:hypothetical protein